MLYGLALGTVPTYATLAEPQVGSITPGERAYLVENLTASKRDFLMSIHGLTAAQWIFKPGPDRWSVQECAEHIILAEDVLFADEQKLMATPAVQRPASSDDPHDRALVAEVLDRIVKAKAPAAITPHGRLGTPEAAAEEFTKLRDRTIAYAKSTNDALRAHAGDGPAGGINDAYQFLLVLAAHTERHTAQIREVQGSAGYPVQVAAVRSASRNGEHDFDFDFGTWRTHVSRLEKPLTGSTTWSEMDGVTVVDKVWDGRANIAVLEADCKNDHLELLSLRLYNPSAQQWSLNFGTSDVGVLSVPMVGGFHNGDGAFYDQEEYQGRTILVRFTIRSLSPTSAESEQAFSSDGGGTWETNWINRYTRVSEAEAASIDRSSKSSTIQDVGIQHDFDFNFGEWKTHISRLLHPLRNSSEWTEYDGTSKVRKVWQGRASLFELEADGPAGHIEGVGLRLYNPASHQWSLNWANSDGIMTTPMVGSFKGIEGMFFDQEKFGARSIYVRNGFSKIAPDSSSFEQAFSDDGGKTWETNWVMTFRR